jgi:hypothetical protein
LDIVKNGSIVGYETKVKINNSFVNHDKNQLIPIKDELGDILNIMQVSQNIIKNGDLLTTFPTRGMFEDYYEKVKLFISLFIIEFIVLSAIK